MEFLLWILAVSVWGLIGAPAYAWYSVSICHDDLTTSGSDIAGLLLAAVFGPFSWLVSASFLPGQSPKVILRAKRHKHPQQQP